MYAGYSDSVGFPALSAKYVLAMERPMTPSMPKKYRAFVHVVVLSVQHNHSVNPSLLPARETTPPQLIPPPSPQKIEKLGLQLRVSVVHRFYMHAYGVQR